MAPRKKKKDPEVASVIETLIEEPSVAQQAWTKAQDLNMTTENNPLATETQDDATIERRIQYNMDRLIEDAALRRKPGTGNVYAGIMGMRYGG